MCKSNYTLSMMLAAMRHQNPDLGPIELDSVKITLPAHAYTDLLMLGDANPCLWKQWKLCACTIGGDSTSR